MSDDATADSTDDWVSTFDFNSLINSLKKSGVPELFTQLAEYMLIPQTQLYSNAA